MGNPDDAENRPAKRLPPALVVRGSSEWKAYIERGAKHCRLNVSTLADLAIARYLREQGFTEIPPPR